MSSLVALLDSLRLDDGRLDLPKRRAELDTLIHSLSHHEIRRLQSQLSKVLYQKDICGTLPAELVLAISEYLDFEDLIRTRHVSHRWLDVFSTPDITMRTIQRYFPLDWEQISRPPDSATQDLDKETLLRWFAVATDRKLRRLRGHYSSLTTLNYPVRYVGDQQTTTTIEAPRRSRQYCAGRVALKKTHCSFSVLDLRTNQTVEIMEKHRWTINRWTLTDEYLVGTTSRNLLLAWPLKKSSNETCYVLHLPNRIRKVSGKGDQVILMTNIKELFVWQVGGALKSLGIQAVSSIPYAGNGGILHSCTNFDNMEIPDNDDAAIIFHPHKKERFFLVWYWRSDLIRGPNDEDSDTGNVKMYVQEVVHNQPGRIYDTIVPCGRNRVSPPTMSGYLIFCLVRKASDCEACPEIFHAGLENEKVAYLTTISFDILNRKFSNPTFPVSITAMNNLCLSGWHRDYYPLIWNDNALVAFRIREAIDDIPVGGEATTTTEKITVFISKQCDHTKSLPESAPHRPNSNNGSQQAQMQRPSFDRGWKGQLMWSVDGIFVDPQSRVRIEGDDDFVVAFGDLGMVIACFNENVKIRPEMY